jgi:hypothetical protein
MSDFDRDPQVDRLLNGVGNEVAGYLDPRGVDMIYAAVRQRRRNRALAVGALALALLGGPTVGLALAGGDSARPPAGGGSSATSPAASPSVGASATAPATGSATPSAPAAPDGRISLDELERARLDLPPWPEMVTDACRQGDVDFVGRPAYSDVDHDGAQETAVVLRCSTLGELKVFKVMVFDRTAAGEIRTVGQVLATPGAEAKAGDVRIVWAVQAGAGGQVRVDVGDYFPCCAMPRDLPQHQWRTFGWDGRRFTQTGGPRTFGPNPKVTDLAISANDLVMARQPDGRWHGTLTLDISNAGPFAVPATIRLSGTAVLGADGGAGWDRCDRIPVSTVPIEQNGTSCQLGTVQVGQSRRLSLRFVTPFSPTGTLWVYVGYENSDGEGYLDRVGGNNEVRPAVRAS